MIMANGEINNVAVGDLVTTQRSDATRTGRVLEIQAPTTPGSELRTLLTLESVIVSGLIWTEWVTEDMIVTPAFGRLPVEAPECGHEITGGYVYTGVPTDSRSMTLRMTALHDIDGERTWVRAWDPEDMEVEVTITGLTVEAIDRLLDDPPPTATAMSALRALMSTYLDATRRGAGLPRSGMSNLPVSRTQWRAGAGDMLVQLVMVTLGLDADAATVWLAEELQEMLANRG